MGKDRPWKTAFPEHLRRSRSRKAKWQKKLKTSTKELEHNLEKLENRIFAKRRQEKMRKARIEARYDMKDASFPQFPEPEVHVPKAGPTKASLVPRLEDPDADIFIPSDDSDPDPDDDDMQQTRHDRKELKDARRAWKVDPLGLDDAKVDEADEAELLEEPRRRTPAPKEKGASSRSHAKKPKDRQGKAGGRSVPKAGKAPAISPKPASVPVHKVSRAPAFQDTSLLKKRKRHADGISAHKEKRGPPEKKRKGVSAYERRQMKKKG